MRVLVAPDSFGGTLTAVQAAEALAAGWGRGAPHDDVVRLPLADGGPGFVDILHASLGARAGGDLVPVTVSGPLGEPAPAMLLCIPADDGVTVYVEAAHAVGLHLVPPAHRDPTRTSSAGVGELVRAAIGLGATRVVVGLGGSATNDGGAGILAALGMASPLLRLGGGALADATADDVADLAAARAAVAGVDLVVAADVDLPLLGLHGASAGFAPQKGATPEQAQHLERALGHLAALLGDLEPAPPDARAGVVPERPTLPLAGAPRARRWSTLPGAGAAGGIGFGLAVLGARILPGSGVVADAVGLATQVAAADLVVTGEGRFDWQSLHGKVVSTVAAEALARAVPVVVVAGQVAIGRREWAAAGVSGAYAVAERSGELAASLADPAGTLAARAARVARTWSPARAGESPG